MGRSRPTSLAESQAWCIATEIDWDSTIVAGSTALAEAVVADDRPEVYAVSYDDDLGRAGDTGNPRPPWLRVASNR